MKNYYEILEVNPKASDEIIKKIYKKITLIFSKVKKRKKQKKLQRN